MQPPAAREAAAVLATMVRRIALAARLRVTEDRATHLVHSAGRGITLTLIGMPEDERDLALSTLTRESVIATITTDAPPAPTGGDTTLRAAVVLRASLDDVTALTKPERALLAEWLDRLLAGA